MLAVFCCVVLLCEQNADIFYGMVGVRYLTIMISFTSSL